MEVIANNTDIPFSKKRQTNVKKNPDNSPKSCIRYLLQISDKMPSQSHLKTLEAIRRSSLHQSVATPSSSIAMMRFRAAAVADPAKALDLVCHHLTVLFLKKTIIYISVYFIFRCVVSFKKRSRKR